MLPSRTCYSTSRSRFICTQYVEEQVRDENITEVPYGHITEVHDGNITNLCFYVSCPLWKELYLYKVLGYGFV